MSRNHRSTGLPWMEVGRLEPVIRAHSSFRRLHRTRIDYSRYLDNLSIDLHFVRQHFAKGYEFEDGASRVGLLQWCGLLIACAS